MNYISELLLLLRVTAAPASKAVLVLGKKNAGSAARAEFSAGRLAAADFVFLPNLHVLVLLLASRLFSFARHGYHDIMD